MSQGVAVNWHSHIFKNSEHKDVWEKQYIILSMLEPGTLLESRFAYPRKMPLPHKEAVKIFKNVFYFP